MPQSWSFVQLVFGADDGPPPCPAVPPAESSAHPLQALEQSSAVPLRHAAHADMLQDELSFAVPPVPPVEPVLFAPPESLPHPATAIASTETTTVIGFTTLMNRPSSAG